MTRRWVTRAAAAAVGSVIITGVTGVTGATGGIVAAQQQQRQGGPRENLTPYLPPGDGKELVATKCTSCHDLKGTLRLRKTAEGWEAIVLDMGARGAPIEIEQIDPIVKYLSEAFGPTAPPFTDVSTATKDDLVKLAGVTPDAADRLLAARSQGPIASHAQVQAALGLDAPAFEKIKPYVYLKQSSSAAAK